MEWTAAFNVHKRPWMVRLEAWLETWLLPNPAFRHELRNRVFRLLALTEIFFAVYYLYFRYTDSLNYNAPWFANGRDASLRKAFVQLETLLKSPPLSPQSSKQL
jgi:hypothetical protein